MQQKQTAWNLAFCNTAAVVQQMLEGNFISGQSIPVSESLINVLNSRSPNDTHLVGVRCCPTTPLTEPPGPPVGLLWGPNRQHPLRYCIPLEYPVLDCTQRMPVPLGEAMLYATVSELFLQGFLAGCTMTVGELEFWETQDDAYAHRNPMTDKYLIGIPAEAATLSEMGTGVPGLRLVRWSAANPYCRVRIVAYLHALSTAHMLGAPMTLPLREQQALQEEVAGKTELFAKPFGESRRVGAHRTVDNLGGTP